MDVLPLLFFIVTVRMQKKKQDPLLQVLIKERSVAVQSRSPDEFYRLLLDTDSVEVAAALA